MNACRRCARLLVWFIMSAFGASAAAQQAPSSSPRPDAAQISLRLAQAERSRALEGSVQSFPNKPIRYISPYAPGGSTSFIARLIGQQLTEAWGQQVVVDNRRRGQHHHRHAG